MYCTEQIVSLGNNCILIKIVLSVLYAKKKEKTLLIHLQIYLNHLMDSLE